MFNNTVAFTFIEKNASLYAPDDLYIAGWIDFYTDNWVKNKRSFMI